MIDPDLLEKLCCPDSHQRLSWAEPCLIEQLNAQVTAGELRNRAGQAVTERFDGGLIREDRRWLYPVREGIPVLLVDEAIELPSGR